MDELREEVRDREGEEEFDQEDSINYNQTPCRADEEKRKRKLCCSLLCHVSTSRTLSHFICKPSDYLQTCRYVGSLKLS